jgi:hypothetical protein
MARPFRLAPPIFESLADAAAHTTLTDSEAAARGYLPASVTDSWDNLRHTLGHTVPFNVNQALASAKRLRTLR